MDKKTSEQEQELKQKQSPEATKAAGEAAEADIQNDPDLNPPPDPADDLDEGELARLEGED